MSYTNQTSWIPVSSDPTVPIDFATERDLFHGVTISAIAFGIMSVYSANTVYLLFKPATGRPAWELISFVSLLWILSIMSLASNMQYNEEAYIDYRNFPGGAANYLAYEFADPVGLWNSVVFIMTSWFADGLVLWRFLRVWNFVWWMSIIPVLMYLGAFSTSIGLLNAITHSSDTFFGVQAVNFGISYWTLSISLNIILTCFIVGRIIFMRRKVKMLTSMSERDPYTSIIAMLIESASLYSIWGLCFLILYARDSPAQHIFLPTLGIVEALAPVLIIYRVAQGRAWTPETEAALKNSTAPSRSWVTGTRSENVTATVHDSTTDFALSSRHTKKENKIAFAPTDSMGTRLSDEFKHDVESQK